MNVIKINLLLFNVVACVFYGKVSFQLDLVIGTNQWLIVALDEHEAILKVNAHQTTKLPFW
jgi:hypothetical protein